MSKQELAMTSELGERTREQVNDDRLVSVIDTFGEQNIRTHVVDARIGDDGPTLVVPRSYDSRLDSDLETDSGPDEYGIEVQRDRAIAAATGSRVIGVDMPGIGLNTDAKSSLGQLYQAGVNGNIEGLSVAQMEAVIAAGNLNDNDEVQLLGYSLGAWSVAEIVKAMQTEKLSKKLRISGVALFEMVNSHGWNLKTLMDRIGEETNEENVNRYLAYNNHFSLAQPRDRSPDDYLEKQKADAGKGGLLTLAIGAGMRRGFMPGLAESYQRDKADNTTGIARAPLVVARTDGSTVARRTENMASLWLMRPSDSLLEFGPDEDGEEHRHPIWQSVAHAALVAEQLRHRME